MGEETGVRFQAGAVKGCFSLPQSPDRLWRLIFSTGTRGSSLGVKRQGREADHIFI